MENNSPAPWAEANCTALSELRQLPPVQYGWRMWGEPVIVSMPEIELEAIETGRTVHFVNAWPQFKTQGYE